MLTFCGIIISGTSKAAVHTTGTNVSSNGTIYLITDDGQRRPYTSAGAFLSYGFNSWSKVSKASEEDLSLPIGSFIPPRDGKIICSDRGIDKGTCYLMTNGKKAAFVSEKVFKDAGFTFTKALYGDVSFLDSDSDINDSADKHRPGVLINKSGTMYLVTSDGLLGVPSADVLKTWGYSSDDVVQASAGDSLLVQSSVISAREGSKLTPSDNSLTGVSESSVIQGYLDTYPDLPTTTIVDGDDGALVIDLIKKIRSLPGTSFDVVNPYLSSKSISLLSKTPVWKNELESYQVYEPAMNDITSNVQIYQGGTTALYTVNEKQASTDYEDVSNWVCVKENGVWKWDFVGTLKYNFAQSAKKNPGKLFTEGNRVNDLVIEEAKYLAGAAIDNPGTYVYFQVRNTGGTTVKKFRILVKLNDVIVFDDIYSYEIKPGKSLILGAPIDYYWKINGVNKKPGRYSTVIKVGFDQATVDYTPTNNSYTLSQVFDYKNPTSSPVSNLVGGN